MMKSIIKYNHIYTIIYFVNITLRLMRGCNSEVEYSLRMWEVRSSILRSSIINPYYYKLINFEYHQPQRQATGTLENELYQ